VAVLGATGFNVGAGMTGGVLYVLDGEGKLDGHLNTSYVKMVALEEQDKERIKSLVKAHAAYTESPRAKEVLADFTNSVNLFKKVAPK
jgi:glutamate synthase domain-containing protein 3